MKAIKFNFRTTCFATTGGSKKTLWLFFPRKGKKLVSLKRRLLDRPQVIYFAGYLGARFGVGREKSLQGRLIEASIEDLKIQFVINLA